MESSGGNNDRRASDGDGKEENADQSNEDAKEAALDENDEQDDINYVYRDYSQIRNDPNPAGANEGDMQLPAPQKLPARLNAMLTDPALADIITWLPHGRSWRILDRYRFTNETLPQYFDHSNLNSFVRLVNAWGFRRVPSGVDSDSYYHELFLRGMPHLHARMKRLLLNEKKAPVELNCRCPNFYEMPLSDRSVANEPSNAPTPHNAIQPGTNATDLASLIRNFQGNPLINQQMVSSLSNTNPNIQGITPYFNPYIANMFQAFPQIANSANTSQQQHQQHQQAIIAAQMNSLANAFAQQYQVNLIAQQAFQAASQQQQNHAASLQAASSHPQVLVNIGQQHQSPNSSSMSSNPSSVTSTNPAIANLMSLLCNPVQTSTSQQSNSQFTGNLSNTLFNTAQSNASTEAIDQGQNPSSDATELPSTSSENQTTESSTDLNPNEDENNDSKPESSK